MSEDECIHIAWSSLGEYAVLLLAGVVLTCGKDDLLKITDARTFQACGPAELRATPPVSSCALTVHHMLGIYFSLM